jgi:hypothetical protein
MSHAGIGRFHMRKFILIAAMAVASATSAQAGDSRSLSVAGMDEKVPAALGKAAGAPKIVEAPKPPDLPKPPEARAAETAKPVEAAKPVETAKPAEAPKAEPAPQFVARPAAVGKKVEPGKTNSNKDGQVTFEDKKPVAAKDRPAVEAKPATEAQDKPAVENVPEQKTAKAEKPRRKRSQHWNEARIMRELYRYGVIAGGW